MTSKTGLIVAGVYGAVALYLVLAQGLFGESFIALILGLPWSLAFASFEYGQVSGVLLIPLLILPMVLNAYILYRIGNAIARRNLK